MISIVIKNTFMCVCVPAGIQRSLRHAGATRCTQVQVLHVDKSLTSLLHALITGCHIEWPVFTSQGPENQRPQQPIKKKTSVWGMGGGGGIKRMPSVCPLSFFLMVLFSLFTPFES